MIRLYSILLVLLTPLALLYLLFRSFRNPDYRKRWNERLGWFQPPQRPGGILVHAASMGEVNAAQALIRELASRWPERPIYVTTFTPTGSDRVRELFGDSVFHVYIPLDLRSAVNRFYQRLQPACVLVMETEIWPNLYRQAAQRKIPLLIVNGRISERSMRTYRKVAGIVRPALEQTHLVAAQSTADARRFQQLGGENTKVIITGNLKFDVRLIPGLADQAEALRLAWGGQRPVLLAGSTREGEEEIIIEAFMHLLVHFPDALLVIAPRHPERFDRCLQMARKSGLSASLRSEGLAVSSDTHCFIIDTLGELMRFYAACDVAFVGGTLVPVGGHNPLEPAALGKPVLAGPYTSNVAEIMHDLLQQGAAQTVRGMSDVEAETRRLFTQPELRDRMGHAGRALVKSGQGALEHTLSLIDETLTAAAD